MGNPTRYLGKVDIFRRYNICDYIYNMANSGVKYNIPRRDLAKREIHRLLLEGLSSKQIHEQTGIPERTLSRWIAEIYKEDTDALLNPTKELIGIQMALFRERLAKQYQDILQMAMDSSIEPTDRITAHNLAADMAYALVKTSYELPSIVRKEMPVALVRSIEKYPVKELPLSAEDIRKQNKAMK